mmetsp:Transcript_24218/g.71114  ORF Transcript_24218/g.71114 Transcript_24218/m.71114 type:complete len:242 (-) Transcript_24218:534-1259(-)
MASPSWRTWRRRSRLRFGPMPFFCAEARSSSNQSGRGFRTGPPEAVDWREAVTVPPFKGSAEKVRRAAERLDSGLACSYVISSSTRPDDSLHISSSVSAMGAQRNWVMSPLAAWWSTLSSEYPAPPQTSVTRLSVTLERQEKSACRSFDNSDECTGQWWARWAWEGSPALYIAASGPSSMRGTSDTTTRCTSPTTLVRTSFRDPHCSFDTRGCSVAGTAPGRPQTRCSCTSMQKTPRGPHR